MQFTTGYFFIWLIVALSALVFEMGSPGLFFFLSFSAGGLTAAIASLFNVPFPIQLIIFLISTIVFCIVLRKWSLHLSARVTPTNMHALIGARGIVIKAVQYHTKGTVKLGGQVWSARSNNQLHSIEAGVEVEVVAVKGVHVVVQPLHSS